MPGDQSLQGESESVTGRADSLVRSLPHRCERLVREHPARTLAALVALLSGIAVYAVAVGVFPYHSSNHDEAVYLTQAAMLLEGQLQLLPGEQLEAFRPWFFVAEGERLYPKYAPYPAVLYAIPMALFGEPRIALAVIAAGNAALVYVLGAMAVDRWVGVVAAAVFAVSPMTLLSTSVFLPYAPTTLLNLAFAVLYLRGGRTGSLRSAGLAGLAIGLAFFGRPYTAVLFATPFMLHALWTVGTALRDADWRPWGALDASAVRRNLLTAAFGLAFVGLTLAYNGYLTGDPLVFPYEAFAPEDGPGFGRRRILGHSIEYTPSLAVEANAHVLWYFATRWFTAGLVGTLIAGIGGLLAIGRLRSGVDGPLPLVLLGGLFVSVPLGNLAFWGNYNVLATMSDPTNGLISQFGPFYHFDLLVPLSIFAALALVAGLRKLRSVRPSNRQVFAVAAVVVLVLGGINGVVVASPTERNLDHTENYVEAYQPIEEQSFEDDLVFIPTPYGDWQNHPFQYLRNDPGFDGDVVYALDQGPEAQFEMVDAYPDRQYHRYSYRGEWSPQATQPVTPKLEPLTVHSGTAIDGETTVGVPDTATRARVWIETGGERVEYQTDAVDGRLSVQWSLDESARITALDGTEQRLNDSVSLPDDEATTVVIAVRLVDDTGASYTYRQEAAVRTTETGVDLLWPPERTVCPFVDDCGREGTYFPDQPEEHRSFVSFESEVRADSDRDS